MGPRAVLVPAQSSDAAAAFAIRPGALVKGEVARLLDRGYQKFIQIRQIRASRLGRQLQAIHLFGEELKQLTGSISLYNESLGTTSDLLSIRSFEGP